MLYLFRPSPEVVKDGSPCKFVQKHGLSGLFTGMYISEVREVNSYCFEDTEWDMINQSNERFGLKILPKINKLDF